MLHVVFRQPWTTLRAGAARILPAPNRNGIRDGRTGTLTVIQRFGSGLNLNVHFHTLIFDGVFRRTPAGGLTFHPAFPPRDAEVAQALDTIRRRVRRLLRRRAVALSRPRDDRMPSRNI